MTGTSERYPPAEILGVDFRPTQPCWCVIIYIGMQHVLREVRIHLQFVLRLQLFWEKLERFVEVQAYNIAYCAFRVAYLLHATRG